jgi:hypothetical protein
MVAGEPRNIMPTTDQLPFDPKAMDFREFAAFLRRSDPAFVYGGTNQVLSADSAARAEGLGPEANDSIPPESQIEQ